MGKQRVVCSWNLGLGPVCKLFHFARSKGFQCSRKGRFLAQPGLALEKRGTYLQRVHKRYFSFIAYVVSVHLPCALMFH